MFHIIKAGSRLFHGTLEDFDADQLRASSLGGLLWTASTPNIAQSYIPVSGSATITSARNLRLPTQQLKLQRVQRYIGIDYDISKVDWDPTGRAESFPLPAGWENIPEGKQVYDLLIAKGFRPRWNDSGEWAAFEFRSKQEDMDDFMLPGQKSQGRLFIIEATADLCLVDFTHGGEIEGDMMNLQYNSILKFTSLDNQDKYDGVLINDFAQTEECGNYGHRAAGLFRRVLSKLKWEVIPASHPDSMKEWGTPEWVAYCASKGIDPTIDRKNVPFL